MRKALLISCFNWYKARLEPVRDLLIEKGYKVTVLIADFDHIKKTKIEERYEECTYIHVPEYRRNLSFQRIQSHLAFGKTVGDRVREEKPDLIYLQVPPNNTARFCTEYKRSHPDTRLIVDIIDLWPESMPLGAIKKTPLARKWKNWRDQCIVAADHVFTECDLYQNKLELDREKTSTLYLFKEQGDKEKTLVRESVGNKKDGAVIRFAYIGSMNSIIDIDGICGVIQRFTGEGQECELHAIGDGESREAFQEAVNATGCKAVFYGPIFDEETKIRTLAPCDYAFNMMKDTSEVGLTIKSIDYLSYGLPLINNIKGDTWRLVDQYTLGINISGDRSADIPDRSGINRENIIRVFNLLFSKDSFVSALRKNIL